MMGLQNIASALNLRNGTDAAKKSMANGTGVDKGHVEDDGVPLNCTNLCRRLRHVEQLAVRGLDYHGQADADGFVLEITAPRTGEVLERSDVFQTLNPTWAPVCGVRNGRNLAEFEMRAVSVEKRSVFWQSHVTMPELAPLCGELEDLRTLPPFGVPLLRLGARWHVVPTDPSVTLASPTASGGSKASDTRKRNQGVKQIQASEICGAGDRISVLLDRLKVLQAQSADLRDRMEASLTDGQDLLHHRRQRRLLHQQRVKQLQAEVERRRRGVAELRAQLDSTRDRGSEQAERLLHGRGELRRVVEDHEEAAPVLAGVYRELRLLWRQLRCRQMRMLHEVCQVYPIENQGKYRTIRRLFIANIDTLSRQDLREEESVSTALGFLAHLLVTLAGILEVPLRINMHQAGCSRSSVSDPHEQSPVGAAPAQWPLYYGRTIEKSRFVTALHLLRDGLHQFLYSRGYFDEKRLLGGNLLECAELILHKEMRGAEQL